MTSGSIYDNLDNYRRNENGNFNRDNHRSSREYGTIIGISIIIILASAIIVMTVYYR